MYSRDIKNILLELNTAGFEPKLFKQNKKEYLIYELKIGIIPIKLSILEDSFKIDYKGNLLEFQNINLTISFLKTLRDML